MTKLDKSRKTYHWYNRLSRKCLIWAIFNGYIIEGKFVDHTVQGKRKRDFDSFNLDVIHQLAGDCRVGKRQSIGRGDPEDRLDGKDHEPFFPEDATTDNLCAVCLEKRSMYKRREPAQYIYNTLFLEFDLEIYKFHFVMPTTSKYHDLG
jgi:hypothetical protein